VIVIFTIKVTAIYKKMKKNITIIIIADELRKKNKIVIHYKKF